LHFYLTQAVWFSGEDLPLGIRASSRLCLALPPILHEGRVLTDGGVGQNYPLSGPHTDERDFDFDGIYLVVDCNVGGPVQARPHIPHNPLGLLLEILQDAILELGLKEIELFQVRI
jgi:predicted acylesterase/phospholipase RssA